MPQLILKASAVWAMARRKRVFRFLVYALMLNAGLLSILYPPESLVWFMGEDVTRGFGAYLLVGGVLSLGGTVTDLWMGEYLGLVLLASGVATYAVAVFAASPTDPRKAAGAMFLGTLFLLLADRWLDVRGTGRQSAQVSRHGRE